MKKIYRKDTAQRSSSKGTIFSALNFVGYFKSLNNFLRKDFLTKVKLLGKKLIAKTRNALIKVSKIRWHDLKNFSIQLKQLIIRHYKAIKRNPSLYFKKNRKRIFVGLGLLISSFIIIVLLSQFSGPKTPKAPKFQKSDNNYHFQASNDIFTTYVGEKNGDNPKVSFTVQDKTLAFTMREGNKVEPQNKNGTIIFPEVAPNTDLTYQTVPNGIKEEIILHQNTDQDSFYFDLDGLGIQTTSVLGEFQTPVFYDQQGNYLFHFERPFAYDAQGNQTYDATISIEKDDKTGTFQAKLSVSSTWLNDPERVYPIYIDPTIIHDESSEFSGHLNRSKDAGSGSNPRIETYYQELPADEHTIGLWHINEGTDNTCSGGEDVCDSSGNGYHGTFAGTAAFDSSAKIGSYATLLDGNSDYIATSNITELDGAKTISASVWVKLNDTSVDQMILGSDILSNLAQFIIWRDETGGISGRTDTFSVLVSDGTNEARVEGATGIANDDQWHHIAITYQGNNASGLRLYIDGVEDPNSGVSTTSVTSLETNSNTFYIGAASPAATYFNGYIDEVRLSNVVRTPEEIKNEAQRRPYSTYTSEVIDLTNAVIYDDFYWNELGVATGDGETASSSADLVAQWNFNETSGTTADNAEGTAALDGTLSGFTTTTSQDAAVGSGWTSDNRRWGAGALMFDGSNDYVTVSHDASLNLPSSGSTYSYWINCQASSSYNYAINKYNNGSYNGYSIYVNPTCDTIGFFYGLSSSNYIDESIYVGANTLLNKWAYIVHALEGSTLKTYVNGKLIDTATSWTVGSPTDTNTTYDLWIGYRNTSTPAYHHGSLDTLSLYSRALPAHEILSNYNAGNIEFLTRSSADNSTWEDWKPLTSETQIESFDSYTSPDPSITINTGDGSDGALSVTSGTTTLDTDANPGGFDYTSVYVASGATLTASGSNPLIIRSQGIATISGTIDLDGSNGTNGSSAYCSGGAGGAAIAGGGAGGDGGPYNGHGQDGSGTGGGGGSNGNLAGGAGGGGGAGFATAGTAGNAGSSTSGGAAGISYGSPALSTLEGGSGGGGAGGNNDSTPNCGAGGGGGGGAISIDAPTISISGTITADGGNGGNNDTSVTESAAGGGGSGGAILLRANTISASGASIGAAAGSGGNASTSSNGDGGAGAVGRIAFYYNDSLSGSSTPTATEITKETLGYQSSNNTFPNQEGTASTQIATKVATDSATVLYLPLDETNGDLTGDDIFDQSGNGNDGEINGTNLATGSVDGIVGNARIFNGSNDYISIADDSTLDTAGTFSIEAWVKPTSLTSRQGIYSTRSSNSTGSWQLEVGPGNGGTARVSISGVSTWLFDSANNAVTAGKWNHIVYTRSSNSDTGTMYVNGQPVSASATAAYTIIDNNATKVIGQGTSGAQFFSGTIDEVRHYNKALSAEEVATRYKLGNGEYINTSITSTDLSSKTHLPFYIAADRPGTYLSSTVGESDYANYQPDSNTLALWHFDELVDNSCITGADACDDSGNYFHATATGNSYITDGVLNQSRYFDGSGDYLTTNENIPLANSSFTIEAWAKRNGTGTTDYIVSQGTNTTSNGLHFGFRSTNYFTCAFYSNDLDTSNTYTDLNWHHWACTYDVTTNDRKLYRDGILVAQDTASADYSGTGTMRIGNSAITASSDFLGHLDEVRISDTVRSADEIRQAYEVSARSHSITIDFGGSLDSGNLISNSADTSFTVDATTRGLSQMGSNLYYGDKIIVKENYGGTEYIAQADVLSVTPSTGAVTVSSWDAGSTFPTSGFTANATVFKWQREYWDITKPLDDQLNAVTDISFQITNGNEGRTIWIDDLKSSGGYLSNPLTNTLTSTAQRYFQYKAILSSSNQSVSPQLSYVALDYTDNTQSAAPTIENNYLHDNLRTSDTTPEIRFSTSDPEDNNLVYTVQYDTDADFASAVSKVSSTDSGFANITTPADTSPFNDDDIIGYTFPTLSNNTTYFYRIKSNDGFLDSPWSETRSFTIDTSTSFDAWFQTHADQFTSNVGSSSEQRLYKSLTITNSGSAETNYEAEVTVDTATLISAGKMQSDCDDLKFFTDPYLINELDLYIESGCNTSTTKAWVRIPELAASGDTVIYMAYNDPTATASTETWSGTNYIAAFESACPTGWTDVSSLSSNNYFPRGSAIYGLTGGATTHTHTYSATTTNSPTYGSYYASGAGCAQSVHNHTVSGTTAAGSSLPAYVDVVYCSYDNGMPNNVATTNYLGFFETTPTGWTHDSGFDGKFLRANTTAGGSGGGDTHTHTVSGTTSTRSSSTCNSWGDGSAPTRALNDGGHSHTYSDDSASASTLPPYLELVLANPDTSSTNLAGGMITMMDSVNLPPMGWSRYSSLDGLFIRGASSSGGTGGITEHSHSISITTANVSATWQKHSGSVNISEGTHSHSFTTTSSTDEFSPPYETYIFAQRDTDSTSKSFGSETSLANSPIIVDDINNQVTAQTGLFQDLTISNYGAAQNDYDALLTINTEGIIASGNMQSDCDDLAFWDSPGVGANRISSYIESGCNTGTTKVWVRLPTLEAGDNTIYMSYGNSSASSNSLIWYGDVSLPFSASCPTGWSATTEINSSNLFLRGSSIGGTASGSATHTHEYDFDTGGNSSSDQGDNDYGLLRNAIDHTHNMSGYVDDGSSIPPYREAIFCQPDDSGTIPYSLDSNVLALFESPPDGWTQNNDYNEQFVRGTSSSITASGSATHTHTYSGYTAATPNSYGDKSSASYFKPTYDHTHAYSGTSGSGPSLPKYYDLVMATHATPTLINNIIAATVDRDMPPLGWRSLSQLNTNNRYLRINNVSGGFSDTDTHTHTMSGTVDATTSTTGFSDHATQIPSSSHTHTYSGTSESSQVLPPYIDTVFFQRKSDSTVKTFGAQTPPYMLSTKITAADIFNDSWGIFEFNDDETNGSITYQVLYDDNGTPTLIPDSDLPGNESGFGTSPVDLSSLSATTYPEIYLKAIFTYDNGSPILYDWGITVDGAPTAPTSLEAEATTNPTNITDGTPEFSAIYNDPNSSDQALYYQIQVSTLPNFINTPVWDSNKTSITAINEGDRSSLITYAGTTLDTNTRYYWRIKFWDSSDLEGAWSSELAYFTTIDIIAPTYCTIDEPTTDDSQLIIQWTDDNTNESNYVIEKNTDGAGFTTFQTKAADSTSHTDTAVSQTHDYVYRIKATNGDYSTSWCSTDQMTLEAGTFNFDGVNLEGLNID